MIDDERQTFRVVVNDEEQYSIWFLDDDVPDGWQDEGTHGTKAQCLDRIEELWSDMRPLSLRRSMKAK